MKQFKFGVGIMALCASAAALAVPPQVSVNWWDNMMFRLGVMADNPGFCRHHWSVPYCR